MSATAKQGSQEEGMVAEVDPWTMADGRFLNIELDKTKEAVRTLIERRIPGVPAVAPIREVLDELVAVATKAQAAIDAWLPSAPCRIWGFDGYWHCNIHKVGWQEKPGEDRSAPCSGYRALTPDSPPSGTSDHGDSGVKP